MGTGNGQCGEGLVEGSAVIWGDLLSVLLKFIVIMFVFTYFFLTPRPCVWISNLVKGFLFYNSEFVKISETYISDNMSRRINVVPTFLSPPLNNSTV